MVTFFFPLRKRKGVFLQSLVWEPSIALGGKLTKVCLLPEWLGPPRIFLSQACSHWGSSNSSVIVHVSLPQHSFLWRFMLHWVVILCSHLSLQIWGQWFALWPNFFKGSKKSYWFSICSAFYLLWGWSVTSKLFTCWTGNWTVLYLFKKMLSAVTFKEATLTDFLRSSMDKL